jgi:hypothetical protein
LPTAIDTLKKLFGQSFANQLQQMLLTDNRIGRRIDDIFEDLCDQLACRIRFAKFVIQGNDATDVAKEAYLIPYVRYANDINITENILSCKPIPDRAPSNKIFKIIDRFLMETT